MFFFLRLYSREGRGSTWYQVTGAPLMAPLTTQVMLMSLPAFMKISRVPVMAAMGTVGQEKEGHKCGSPFLSLPLYLFSFIFILFTFVLPSPLPSFFSLLSIFPPSLYPSLSFPLLATHSPSCTHTHSPSQLTDHFESESSGYLGLRGHLTLVHPWVRHGGVPDLEGPEGGAREVKGAEPLVCRVGEVTSRQHMQVPSPDPRHLLIRRKGEVICYVIRTPVVGHKG